MKQFALALTLVAVCCGLAYAGPVYSEKEMKQVAAAPCPQWYSDNEWNVSLWGTYAMTGTEFAPNPDLFDLVQSSSEGHTVYGTFDKYLGGDHAWGGGIDLKYFFRRYFGIGVEGFVLNARRGAGFDLESNGVDVFIHERRSESRAVGEVLGTFTLRYPIQCSRFSPYVWAGGGVIFGGGERDEIIFDGVGEVPLPLYHTVHHEETTEAVGQFGGGLEFRVTPHIGLMNDFSWNVVNGPQNNFGMFRSGLTFAF
jgi:opacity protein-like surface antigen